ncbi:MAG: DoxX subfamily, partial [Planctomycetota bacterium]
MLFKKAKLTFPAILFLVLLRLVIGWHFFQEGAVKVKEGFSSTPFLSAAKG